MKAAAAVILVAGAVAFQTFALPLYRAGTIAPDFPFLVLFYLALFAAPFDLFVVAFLAAGAVDILSIDPVGTRLIGYLPPLLLTNRLRRGFIAESRLLRAALCLAAAAVASCLQGGFVWWQEGRWIGLSFELQGALYTSLLGLGVHALLDGYRGSLGWTRDRFFA